MNTIQALVAEAAALLDTVPGRVVIGLTGPPGSGKTTLAETLVGALNSATPGSAAYLPMDGFHLSNAVLDQLGRRGRKGAVDTFDVAGYVAMLDRVIAEYGHCDVFVPDFSRSLDEPVAAGGVVPAASRLVVTEGNYLGLSDAGWAPVRGALHRLYYVDCPAEVRRARLIERHIAGGRTRAAATAWVDDVDEPNAGLIATTQDACDHIFTSVEDLPPKCH